MLGGLLDSQVDGNMVHVSTLAPRWPDRALQVRHGEV